MFVLSDYLTAIKYVVNVAQTDNCLI